MCARKKHGAGRIMKAVEIVMINQDNDDQNALVSIVRWWFSKMVSSWNLTDHLHFNVTCTHRCKPRSCRYECELESKHGCNYLPWLMTPKCLPCDVSWF